jgi:hypothetical protein
VARREGHLIQVGWIPRRHDDAPILWIINNLVNAILQLIDTFTRVIGVHVHILGSEVTPLKAIDWSEISLFTMAQASGLKKFLRAISIPNVNVLFGELVGIRVTL